MPREVGDTFEVFVVDESDEGEFAGEFTTEEECFHKASFAYKRQA